MTYNLATLVIALELFILLLCILFLNIEKHRPIERRKPYAKYKPMVHELDGFQTTNKTTMEMSETFHQNLSSDSSGDNKGISRQLQNLSRLSSRPIENNDDQKHYCKTMCLCYNGTFKTLLVR